MSDREWAAFLDTLSPELRHVAQMSLSRVTTLLEQRWSHVLEIVQHAERGIERISRRIEGNGRRIDEAHFRLDQRAIQLDDHEARLTELEHAIEVLQERAVGGPPSDERGPCEQ